jgi:hypothetical protein
LRHAPPSAENNDAEFSISEKFSIVEKTVQRDVRHCNGGGIQRRGFPSTCFVRCELRLRERLADASTALHVWNRFPVII